MGLDEAIKVLEVAATVAEAVPVLGTPVKAALDAAGKIVDFAKAVKANKEQTKELAEKAALWVQSLVNALDGAKTDPSALERLRPDVNQILAALTSIANATEQRTKQSLAKQILHRSKNEDELTKLRDDLEDAYKRFMLSSQVRNEQAISTLVLSQTRNEESFSALLTAADRDTLNTLRPVSSAYYDSLDSPSGCLEGTRQDILAQMMTWAGETSPAISVFWLAGLAGTGKSTIARSFCESVASSDLVLATFFASRSSADRRDPFNIIRTFAYELAVAQPQVRSHVLAAIRSPPDIMQRPMKEQIDRLLAQPLSSALQSGYSLAIVIDALDECNKIGRVEGGTLIPLLAEALRNLPVKLLVTSRQEKSLVGMFDSLTHIPLRLHEVASDAVEPDVRRIFDAGFGEIRREHELTNEVWPTEEDLQSLVRLTGRFFIFAATALRYIGDTRFTPAEQLSHVLARGATLDGEAPYAQIDALYTDILQAATCDNSGNPNPRLRRRVGELVRTVALLEEPLSVASLALLMGTSEADVAKDVNALAAIFLLTKDGRNQSSATVHIFHPSLRDFLIDSQRCRDPDFLVHSANYHHVLAHRCLVTMNQFLTRDICRLQDLTLANSDIEDLTERLVQHVPGALQYACVFWHVHLCAGETPSDSIRTLLLEFCRTHLFHWVELLSLLARLPVAAHLPSVVSWCRSSAANADAVHEASELLNDTYRMMLAYYLPIHSHALHVYYSAIATMPECALFATVSAEAASGVRLLSARAGGWTATLRVLEGQAGEVNSIAFSPDGTLLVSGSGDRTVRIWSMRTGHSLAILEGHTDGVSCVAFSPDGNQIASGSHDRTIRVWNTQSFKEIAVFHHNNGAVYSVAYSSTRSLVIYGSGDGTVCVWDPAADSQAFLEGHKTEVCAVACSPHDSRVVSGSKDGMIQVCDSQTGAKLASLEGHNQVTSVSFSLNGAHLVSGLETGAIRVWDARTYKSISALQGHFDSWAVTSVAFSPDSQKVIFGSGDGTVRVWDALLTKQLAVLSGHLACVTSVAFSPDGAWIASASIDGTIRVWDHQASPEAAVIQHDSLDLVEEILCSLDGLYAVSRAGSHARVWDMQKFAEISRLKGHNSPVTAIAFSPDGLRIASGAGDGRVRVWDTRTGRQLAVFNCNDSNVSAVAFSPDGIRVVSCSMTIRVWSIPSGEQLAHFTGRTDHPSAVTFSPDGLWIIFGSMDGALTAWDTVTGAQVALNQEYDMFKTRRPATKIVFSADGNRLHTRHDTQELAWDFRDIVTCRRASTPREVTPNAPGNPGPNCTESHIRASISWDRWTGWLSYTRKLDSRNLLPLCWLPVERRGPAWTVFRGWMVAVGGQGENVTILDLTDTIEQLQNLGII